MTYAYKHVGATEGSLLSMLTPVLNAVMGLLVFHEPVSMRALAGCAIVLAGCSYAAIPPRVPQAVAEAEGVGRPT
jgi:drug/metabolite transporter (DMT)-like permease